MTSRVPKEVITTRTMRDTLLRTRIMTMIEEYNRMVINLKGITARIIPIKGINRRGDYMVIKKGETTLKMNGVTTATKTGVVMATKRGGATGPNKTGDALATKKEGATVTSKTGEGTVEAKGALTEIKKEGRTGTNRGEHTALLIEVSMAIEVTMGTERGVLMIVELPRGNAVQGWGNEHNLPKGAKVECIAGIGVINHSLLAAGSNRAALGKR